jgi:hypothetical protein
MTEACAEFIRDNGIELLKMLAEEDGYRNF